MNENANTMITLDDYFWGQHEPVSNEINSNVLILLDKVNALIRIARRDGVDFDESPRTRSCVTSGWRSPKHNASLWNAAPKSKHMTGQAIDLYDPEGEIDDWCINNKHELAAVGLYMEHPSATKGWCHLQSVPPKSKRRVFYP